MTTLPDLTRLYTADELYAMGEDARYELARGRLRVMEPAGGAGHGAVIMRLSVALANHVYGRQLGTLFAAESGFQLEWTPDTVRAPDIAFVRAERDLPEDRTWGFFKGPPDLAVEVLSPSDSASSINEKLDDYMSAGVAAVWVVDPARRTVLAYERGGPVRVFHEHETLDGGGVLPDFRCEMTRLFVDLPRG